MGPNSWMQLEGVEQILPEEGWDYEQLRRKLLDRLYQNGYEMVVPPLADFVDALLSGSSQDLDVLTVKVPDHVSGLLYGIRADMTPQVARIAAFYTPATTQVLRLCYMGSALLARATDLGGSRELMQFGAELFGSETPESDCEIIRLMVESLQLAGVAPLSVSIGHVGIFREVFKLMDLNVGLRDRLLNAIQRKSKPDIQELLAKHQIGDEAISIIVDLVQLNGSIGVRAEAKQRLGGLSEGLDAVLDELDTVIELVHSRVAGISLHMDYAQVGGYEYHTGTIFSAYGKGYGQSLAKGGRYECTVAAGTSVPATGFSGDLRLIRYRRKMHSRKPILIPCGLEVSDEFIESLFSQGERVVYELPGQNGSSLDAAADRMLREVDGKLVVTDLDGGSKSDG